jgi:tetratricopeptide (TPR) repeat protein
MRASPPRPHTHHHKPPPPPPLSGIARVFELVWTATTSALATVTFVPAILSGVLFFLLKVLVVTALAMFVGAWALGEDSITIATFIDLSPDTSDTTTPKRKHLGQLVADSLAFELDRISQLHTVKNPWGSPEQIGSPKVTTPEAYERVGHISVSGIELPVGEVLLAVKSFLPHLHQRQAITGSIQQLSTDKPMRMRIIARLEEGGKVLKHWEVTRALQTETDLGDLVNQLAFHIMWSTLSGIGTNSFPSFQAYIEGMGSFRKYKDTHHLDDFLRAEQKFFHAIEENLLYIKAHFFLGVLYSWRLFYERSDPTMIPVYEQKAVRAFRKIITLAHSSDDQSHTLAQYGLELVAHRRYMKDKQEEAYNGYDRGKTQGRARLHEAHRYYTEALRLNPEFHFARTGRALVYKERGCLRQATTELQKSVRQAKAEQTRQQHTKRHQEWIEKEVTRLEAQEKRQHDEWQKLAEKIQELKNGNHGGEIHHHNRSSRLLAIPSGPSAREACA